MIEFTVVSLLAMLVWHIRTAIRDGKDPEAVRIRVEGNPQFRGR